MDVLGKPSRDNTCGFVTTTSYEKLKAENARMRWRLEVLKAYGIEIVDAVAGGYEIYSDDHKEAERLKVENAKLLEQIELLTTILRNDCDIDASWDGLRRFWSIELTESGCLMRDSACKAEAENAKLRKFAESYLDAVAMAGCHFCPYDDIDLCDTETDPMRDGCRLYEEMRELGIEVNE